MALDKSDFKQAATILGCDIAAVMAVAEVESSGGGFLTDGKVKILFEGHKFSKFTKGQYDASHPDVSYPKWDKSKYSKGVNAEARGQAEWARLNRAATLDKRSALMSASWGMFQIMGFNFTNCAFKSVDEFVAAMKVDEGAQLDAFCQYLKTVGLDKELREHRWSEFARRYNGADYQVNKYDIKLAKAWARHAG